MSSLPLCCAAIAFHRAPHARRLMRSLPDRPERPACSLPSRVNKYRLTRGQPIRHPIAAACGPLAGDSVASARGVAKHLRA
jgi:hypothetical protein